MGMPITGETSPYKIVQSVRELWQRIVGTDQLAGKAVTFAKMQDITSDRLIGRDTPASGSPEEIAVANGLEFTGSQQVGIANDGVNNARLADMVQATIKGRAAAAGTGDPTDLTAAQVLAILGSLVSSVALQSITASGDYTPTSGMVFCIVISTGGGGGGGGADAGDTSAAATGGGGGAAATCIERFTAAQIGSSQTVTIGAGGNGGANTGANGADGGNTTFGALHTAGGGKGGKGVATSDVHSKSEGGAGGTATGGLVNVPGGDGHFGSADSADAIPDGVGGNGGASLWGGGARGGIMASATGVVAGNAATVPGAGGGGAVAVDDTTGATGGDGAGGICVILEFL